ncbi:MAG: hypothetical protein U5N26_02645 [Candidatus Marinimicrobia bacterium]|nr:hypothetical protein [Candidatus Neomarinimicrobiota bacterium]
MRSSRVAALLGAYGTVFPHDRKAVLAKHGRPCRISFRALLSLLGNLNIESDLSLKYALADYRFLLALLLRRRLLCDCNNDVPIQKKKHLGGNMKKRIIFIMCVGLLFCECRFCQTHCRARRTDEE